MLSLKSVVALEVAALEGLAPLVTDAGALGSDAPMTLSARARSALPRPELNSVANFTEPREVAPCPGTGFDGGLTVPPGFCVVTGCGGLEVAVEGFAEGGLVGSLNMGRLLWVTDEEVLGGPKWQTHAPPVNAFGKRDRHEG